MTYEKAQNEKAYSGTLAAVWLRLRAAADNQRGREQQSFRYIAERTENGRAN